MAQRWIEMEFNRTGLPKAALAAYLGLDNAAVSRIMNGERAISTEEEGLTRGFFSTVAPAADANERDAIHRLRSTKIRDVVSLALAKWLIAKANQQRPGNMPDPKEETFLTLISDVAAQNSSLRADQIVALCRLLGISLGELLRGNGVHARNKYNDDCPVPIFTELEAAARRWAQPGSVPYQFHRPWNAPRPRPIEDRIHSVLLQLAEPDLDELASCVPYLIPDNSNAPRFEQGQTIYVDQRSEPRRGEYVAIFLSSPQSGMTMAVLGKLLYAGRETVGVNSGRNGKTEIPRSEVSAVSRIAYCKL